jgi:SAM-dependent methyltransferase
VDAGVSGFWRQLTGGAHGPWTFWKFNWLAHHKLIRALQRARTHARGELLDVGCGAMPYAPLFDGRVTRYWGTDLRGSPDLGDAHPVAYARAEAQPFRAGSFDTVMGLAMFSYVPEPQRMLAEVHRVLKPGGVLLLECVQMAPLYPLYVDYYRYTRHGAAYVLKAAGFEPVEFIAIGGLWARVGLSLIAPLNRINRGPTRVLTELPVRALYVVIQLACEALDRLFFDPGEVLSHLVVARRMP